MKLYLDGYKRHEGQTLSAHGKDAYFPDPRRSVSPGGAGRGEPAQRLVIIIIKI